MLLDNLIERGKTEWKVAAYRYHVGAAWILVQISEGLIRLNVRTVLRTNRHIQQAKKITGESLSDANDIEMEMHLLKVLRKRKRR